MRQIWHPVMAVALVAIAGAACAPAASQALNPDQIPAAFIAATQAPDRTMHMQWSGTYMVGALGAATMPFTASIDFAGADYAGTVTSSPAGPGFKPGADTQADIAFVGGQAYQRSQYSNGWQRVNPGPPSLDPFRGLTLADLEYVGQQSDGASVHQLRVTDMSVLVSTMFSGLAGSSLGPVHFDAANSSFDIYVDAAAHPTSATLNLGTSADPSEFGSISVTSKYEFSNWGGEFYIVPPPNAP